MLKDAHPTCKSEQALKIEEATWQTDKGIVKL
jgi:hypothetical protein